MDQRHVTRSRERGARSLCLSVLSECRREISLDSIICTLEASRDACTRTLVVVVVGNKVVVLVHVVIVVSINC